MEKPIFYKYKIRWLVFLLSAILMTAFLLGEARSFSFKETEEQEAQEQAAKREAAQQRIKELLSVPCKESLKDKKIALIIGERQENGRYMTKQSNYGLLFQEVNKRLKKVGLRTYTLEEIQRQIAQREIEAFMANDMDAATDAARRLSADFVLRGLIHSRVRLNPVVRINEVFVNMAFTLVDAKGESISDVTAGGESYSGPDTITVALSLVKDKADEVVAQLYHDYCTQASK